MIAIYINNQRADYFGSLTIKKDNPLFADFEIIPTAHTYTLTLPTTSTNAKIFSLVQHTLATPQKLPARIEIDGIQVFDGTCYVQSWNDSGYSVYFAEKETLGFNVIHLLGGTLTLYDIIDDLPNGSVVDWAIGVWHEFEGNNAVVSGFVSTTTSEGSITLETSNVAFSLYFLARRMAQYYNVKLIDLPDKCKTTYIVNGAKPTIKVISLGGALSSKQIFIREALPKKITARNLFDAICAVCGCKMDIDFATNSIKFVDISSDINVQHIAISMGVNINFNAGVKFANIQFKHVVKKTDDVTKSLSQPVAINLGGQKYEVPFAVPFITNGKIELPLNEVNVEDYFLCSFEGSQNSDTGDMYRLTDAEIEFNNLFAWWKVAHSRNIIVKCKMNINPIMFNKVNFLKKVNIPTLGNFYIKSINYNPDADSEIECYPC